MPDQSRKPTQLKNLEWKVNQNEQIINTTTRQCEKISNFNIQPKCALSTMRSEPQNHPMKFEKKIINKVLIWNEFDKNLCLYHLNSHDACQIKNENIKKNDNRSSCWAYPIF